VLTGIDLTVAQRHEVICLIGLRGRVSRRLLRCLNLLEPIYAGGSPVGPGLTAAGVGPEPGPPVHRIVFQSYNLFPHMNVLQNVTARAEEGAGHAPG